MDCGEIVFSGHILRRMFERRIEFDDVLAVIRSGEVIEDYADDLPFPSALVLGQRDLRPLHVVVARDPATRRCVAVTVYEPDWDEWSPDFRRRLTP
ncbi:MAG: hypothetical protein C0506_14890 [Anaerolinea sp.]|nr:hypothetical protein [Anaerolinea sp.]